MGQGQNAPDYSKTHGQVAYEAYNVGGIYALWEVQSEETRERWEKVGRAVLLRSIDSPCCDAQQPEPPVTISTDEFGDVNEGITGAEVEVMMRQTIAEHSDDVAITQLAEEFCAWPLPESVCADLCATKQGPGRIGTNLLSVAEAKQFFEYAFEKGLLAAPMNVAAIKIADDLHKMTPEDREKFLNGEFAAGDVERAEEEPYEHNPNDPRA